MGDGPRGVWAPLAGLLLSWSIVQRVKFLIPSHWEPKSREVMTQALGFVTGVVATGLVWSSGGPWDVDAAMAAVLVGLLSPALWNILMWGIGVWSPGLREVMSQERGRGKRRRVSRNRRGVR
jgi:hypothetical protein